MSLAARTGHLLSPLLRVQTCPPRLRMRRNSVGKMGKESPRKLQKEILSHFYLTLSCHHQLLDLGDRLGGIKVLGAGLGAVHDGVATIEPERILEIVESLACRLVAAVANPAVGLQEARRAEIAVAIPPIARARRAAAGAQDAIVEPVELGPLSVALPALLLGRRAYVLEPRLDRGVLGIE